MVIGSRLIGVWKWEKVSFRYILDIFDITNYEKNNRMFNIFLKTLFSTSALLFMDRAARAWTTNIFGLSILMLNAQRHTIASINECFFYYFNFFVVFCRQRQRWSIIWINCIQLCSFKVKRMVKIKTKSFPHLINLKP